MRTVIIALAATLILAFGKLPASLCDLIDQLKYSGKLHYDPNNLDGDKSSVLIPLNKENFNSLFNSEQPYGKSHLVGKFQIAKKRIGVISCVESFECDHAIQSYYLHVIDQCKPINTFKIMTADNEVIIYEVSSELSRDFKSIEIKTEMSSELGTEPGTLTDTLYTEIVKINLESIKLDTISIRSSFEILPAPIQK